MSDVPMMPKATAVWLVEHTALTFDQIAAFCGLHPLEIQAIADGEVAAGMTGLDPIANDQLTQEDIARCENDPNGKLKLLESTIPLPEPRAKGARYTPVSKRQDKPDGIAWLLRTFPELSDAQIGKLLGTTKPTITAIRDRTHWNAPNIRPRDPVDLGLCSRAELDEAVQKARQRAARRAKDAEREARKAGIEPEADGEAPPAAGDGDPVAGAASVPGEAPAVPEAEPGDAIFGSAHAAPAAPAESAPAAPEPTPAAAPAPAPPAPPKPPAPPPSDPGPDNPVLDPAILFKKKPVDEGEDAEAVEPAKDEGENA